VKLEKSMSAHKTIQHIVILGGGTAGWLSANHLAKKLLVNAPHGMRITLVESPDIPTVGVGEGTVPAIRDTLQYLGITETELIQQCDATFKQSIHFIDWQPALANGKRHSYHHVFDYPLPGYHDYLPDWLVKTESRENFADVFSIQSRLCAAGLAPKAVTQPEYQGLCNYAYHFDAAKFGKLLARHAVEKLGVIHRQLRIVDVCMDEHGHIAHLVSDTGEQLGADLFIDCSGTPSILLGKALNVPFISKHDMLFTDTAIATQVPYADISAAIPCSTLATAQSAGWIWDIGLSHRRGVGLVYSSAHCSDDEAEQQLYRYLGSQAPQAALRKIAMRTGYHQSFWQGNCVAVGLAQGFVEPLEATGLLLFDIAARMLAEQFPANHAAMQTTAKRYNRKMRQAWDRVFDFIKLHYCLSQRQDSDFWQQHRRRDSQSETLSEVLDHWRWHLPSQYDFTDRAAIFNLENYLYVLYGMQFHTDLSAQAWRFDPQKSAEVSWQHMAHRAAQAKQQLLPHRQLLERIQRSGIQPI